MTDLEPYRCEPGGELIRIAGQTSVAANLVRVLAAAIKRTLSAPALNAPETIRHKRRSKVQRKAAAGAVYKDRIAQRSTHHRRKHPGIRFTIRRDLKIKRPAQRNQRFVDHRVVQDGIVAGELIDKRPHTDAQAHCIIG